MNDESTPINQYVIWFDEHGAILYEDTLALGDVKFHCVDDIQVPFLLCADGGLSLHCHVLIIVHLVFLLEKVEYNAWMVVLNVPWEEYFDIFIQ